MADFADFERMVAQAEAERVAQSSVGRRMIAEQQAMAMQQQQERNRFDDGGQLDMIFAGIERERKKAAMRDKVDSFMGYLQERERARRQPMMLFALGGTPKQRRKNRYDGGGKARTILAKDLNEDWVLANANMPVTTPMGERTTAWELYDKYGETPIAWNDLPESYRNNYTNTADMKARETVADANDLVAQEMEQRAADRYVSGLNMTEIDKREQRQNLFDALAYSAAGAMGIYGLPYFGYALAANPIATGASLLGSMGIGLGTNWAVDKLTGKNVGQWLNKGLGIDEDSLAGYMLDPSYYASANRFVDKVARSFAQNAYPIGYDNPIKEKIWPTIKGIPEQYGKYIKSKITGEPAVVALDAPTPKEYELLIPQADVDSRRVATARALNIPIEGGDHIYIPNTDGTVSVSKSGYSKTYKTQDRRTSDELNALWNDDSTPWHMTEPDKRFEKPVVLDYTANESFTKGGNAGNMNVKVYNQNTGEVLTRPRKENGLLGDGFTPLLDNMGSTQVRAIDDFDLQPLKETSFVKRLPKTIKEWIGNIDGIKILGGTPFTMKQTGNVKIDISRENPFSVEWQFPEFQTDIATNIKDVYGLPSRYEAGSRASQMLGKFKGDAWNWVTGKNDDNNTHAYGGAVNRYDDGGGIDGLINVNWNMPSLDVNGELPFYYYGSRQFPIQLNDLTVSAPYNMRKLALERSRNTDWPSYDFNRAQDIGFWQKVKNTLNPDAYTCINTVTGFYNTLNKSGQVAANGNLFNNPEKYGYERISQSEARPGDLVQMVNAKGVPHHLLMFDRVATDSGVTTNGRGDSIGTYIQGDTLLNGSNGDRTRKGYRHLQPLRMFDDEKHLYYRRKADSDLLF